MNTAQEFRGLLQRRPLQLLALLGLLSAAGCIEGKDKVAELIAQAKKHAGVKPGKHAGELQ